MKNLEIKARYPDLDAARRIAEQIGARHEGTYNQIDTYFNVGTGRLKLRESSRHESQLIHYVRPDLPTLKTSRYEIYPVTDGARLKQMLASALGIWRVVEKEREVYWYGEIRIHLDRVKDLGNFVEFEGLLRPASDVEEVQHQLEFLLAVFRISACSLVKGSYSDLGESV